MDDPKSLRRQKNLPVWGGGGGSLNLFGVDHLGCFHYDYALLLDCSFVLMFSYKLL
jgi:hypothetical protein